MYLITYVDRVNISTAADSIRASCRCRTSQLGFLQSAFGYPYLRLPDLRRLDWRPLRPAAHAVPVRPDLGVGDDPHRASPAASTSLFICRLLVGVGEGATFPVATRAMQSWTPVGRRGFAQGLTHAFARLGNAITPPIVAWLIVHGRMARLVHRARLLQPGVGHDLALATSATRRRSIRRSPRGARRSCRTTARPARWRGRRCRGAR